MGYSQFIEASLERLRRDFEESPNALILFRAYGISRRFPREPIPEWILTALDEIARRPEETGGNVQSPGFDWQSVFIRSLGFRASSRGGPSNPFRVAARNDDWYTFAVRMRVLIDGDGQQATYAAEEVAKYWGIDASTVRRAWKRYRAVVRNENLQEQIWNVLASDPPFNLIFGSRRLAHYRKNHLGKQGMEQLIGAGFLEALVNDELEEWAKVVTCK
jgi:hypothetical protein